MRKLLTVLTVTITLAFVSEVSYAQNSGFGLGAMINGPTGISYKGWIDDRVAVAGAVTFSVGEFTDSFYTHADVIVHSDGIFDNGNDMPGTLNLYYGGGVALIFTNNPDDTQVDLRAPLGTVYGMADAPIDIFFELAPTLRVEENTRFFFSGALGVRYFFNNN